VSARIPREEKRVPRFLVLPRDVPAEFSTLSPEEMRAIIRRYGAWARSHMDAGRLETGEKLTDDGGRILRGAGDALRVRERPFTEVKEVVGDLWITPCASCDEIVSILGGCPRLEFGAIEIREIDCFDRD
jgi:hypothetical protein